MANDLAAMKARIISELSRPDLATQVADAITTAISVYQKERFRFSDTDPVAPPQFNTVAGQWTYTSADNANITTAFGFDYVMVTIGNMIQRLVLMTLGEVRQFNQSGQMRGQPMWYGYEGNTLLIAPVPDQAYAVTLGIFRKVLAPAGDGEANNPWMTDAERLIRSRAKYEIALHVTRNPTMQEAMSPEPPNGAATGHAAWHAWRDLKGETNRVTSLGRIKPMSF